MNFNKEGRITNYLKYALGEVILVVFGILIAVSLNNWNKKRVQRDSFVDVIETLREDIKKDTAEAGRILRSYEKLLPMYENVIYDSATEEMYLDSTSYYNSLITHINPLTINTRGYELVKGIKEFGDEESRKFVVGLTQVYSKQLDLNKLNSEIIKNAVEANMVEWKNEKLWFGDLMMGKRTRPYLDYVLNDPFYRNKVMYHSLLVYNNYVVQLLSFNKEMGQLLNETEAFID